MPKQAETPSVRTRTRPEPVKSLSNPSGSVPSPIAPVPDGKSEPGEDDVQRLTVPIDSKTGFIAWDRLRSPDKTANVLKRVFTDSRLSPARSESPEDSAALNAVVVNVLYDAIGMIAVVAARTRGYSETSAQLLRYTADEKAALAPQTVKVLNKYNLLGGKYADEITLLVAVAGITGAHVMAMQEAEAKIQPTQLVQPPAPDILGEREAS